MVYCILIMFTFLIDQATKFMVEKYIPLGTSKEAIKSVVWFTHVQNTGGAFSIFQGKQPFFILTSVVLILILVWFVFFQKLPWINRVALTLILGGALGNLFDRIFRGYVVDFIDIKIWPVFNLADTFISVGIILYGIIVLKERGGESLEKRNT